MFINELISALLQVLAFALIPFLVYLIGFRKTGTFFSFVGLSPTTRRANLMALGISLVIALGTLGLYFIHPDFQEVLTNPKSVTGKFRTMEPGLPTMGILLVMAWIKTGFAEELFFRGFVAKRLMAGLGFQWGNLLQSLIFGLLHFLLFATLIEAPVFFKWYILVMSGLAGYLIGWIKEKHGKGSIIPGWIAHGLGNTLAYSAIGFFL